jgi:protein O-mannosyl-transferase
MKDKTSKIDINSTVLDTPSVFDKWAKWGIMLLGMLLYANTLGHEYTQDDAIVIYDNMYTVKGVAGIPGILSKDTFYGFFKEAGKEKLVSGGRYRPFTLIMFAIEYQIFGKNPFIGHFINMILYGLLGLLIFNLLEKIFANRSDFNSHFKWIILAICAIYIVHPLHTEAVANIKGRDEIMTMIGAIGATLMVLKSRESNLFLHKFFTFLLFTIALFSKENAITFLAIVPLILVLFFNESFGKALKSSIPLFAAAAIFLIIRTAILGVDTGGTPMELMNNPYLKFVNGKYIPVSIGVKLATIIFTLGVYVKLLFYPHPLTHDYYPRHIDLMSFSDPMVLVSLLLYTVLTGIAIYNLNKDRVLAFGILFYLITLSIVSNLIFPIGTNMSERFMFMPSLGFAVVIPYLLYKYLKNGKTVAMICAGICLLFSIKTISRNTVWKDDFTLFTTDVDVSKNSAKILNAAGGSYFTRGSQEKDKTSKEAMLHKSIPYLKKALAVHPQYKASYLLMGNSYFYLENLDSAIYAYEQALNLDPNYTDAVTNLSVCLRDAGRKAGEKEGNIQKAESYLQKAIQLNPKDVETLRLLGVASGLSGNHQKAIEYFKQIIQIEPQNAHGYLNLSNAYMFMKDTENADKYGKLALALDPNIMSKNK